MAGLKSADEIFEQAQAAAVAATSPDEKALQIDYPALREKSVRHWPIARWRSATSINSCPRAMKSKGGSTCCC